MQPPNVIFIITDQQRYDTIRALGYDYMETPHLDRLVREGVRFSGCHVTAASFAPSRASLFTGYYPHTTGIFKNADVWRHSWIELLARSGYRRINIGKMHTYPYHTELGFDERYVVENKDRYLEERFYFDEWDKGLRIRGLVKQQRELYRKLPDCDGILTDTSFMTMVRNNDWKLVHFLDDPTGQLFDLQHDPDEVRNLWNDPDHAGKKQELLDVLREWRIRSDVHTKEWAAPWR